MRLSRSTRPLAALFALWLAVVLGDPGVLHSCPMHGGARGMHGAMHGAHAGVPATSGHAMHASHAAHASQHGQSGSADDSQDHDATGPCTCVGHCCATPTAAPLAIAIALRVPAETIAERDPVTVPVGDAPSPHHYRLPFANGPPLA